MLSLVTLLPLYGTSYFLHMTGDFSLCVHVYKLRLRLFILIAISGVAQHISHSSLAIPTPFHPILIIDNTVVGI